MDKEVLIVRAKLDYKTIIVLSIFLLAMASKIGYIYSLLLSEKIQSIVFSIALIMFSVFSVYEIAWAIFGKVLITTSSDLLIVKTGILFLYKTEKFKIDNISNLRLEQNIDSSTHWGFQGIMIFNKSSTLNFNYVNKKTVSFRGNFSSSDLEKLKKSIRR